MCDQQSWSLSAFNRKNVPMKSFEVVSWKPKQVFQPRRAICAHAHQQDAYIFKCYLFVDIVYNVSTLINYQHFIMIWIVAILGKYFFSVKIFKINPLLDHILQK